MYRIVPNEKLKQFYNETRYEGMQDKLLDTIGKTIGIKCDKVNVSSGVIDLVNKGKLNKDDLMLLYEEVHMKNGFDNSEYIDHIVANAKSIACDFWKVYDDESDILLVALNRKSLNGRIEHYFTVNGIKVWYKTLYNKKTMEAESSIIYLATEY